MARRISQEATNKRVKQMVDKREHLIKTGEVENVHVKLQKGNRKTGVNCWTVSLIPIADCGKNCKECSKDCYDIRNDCWMTVVQNDRAIVQFIKLTLQDIGMKSTSKSKQIL